MTLAKAFGLGVVLLLSRTAMADGKPVVANDVPAVILKVEGEGIANVRKRSGVTEIAGAGGKVYPGDKVVTDVRSAVHLLLNDGTVVKVGFNTEFNLASIENHGRFLTWLFRLGRGSIRALVEKLPTRDIHLKVETPNGTVGVRGTEFVLTYDDSAGSSFLYMIDGLVSYGATDCEKTKSCVDVRAGETTTMIKGRAAPARPQKFEVKDLFGASAAGGGGPHEARLALFTDVKKIAQSKNVDEAGMKKLVEDSSSDLAAAQDRAIGRTKTERDAMHVAIANGTFDNFMAAADAYSEAKGIFHAQSNGGAENLVAQTAAAKFRLGQAVVAADKAGVFADKQADSGGGAATPPTDGAAGSVPDKTAGDSGQAAGGSAAAAGATTKAAPSPKPDVPDDDYSDRTFKERKSMTYDQSADTKAKAQVLAQAADDYKGTLDYVEALDAKQAAGLAAEKAAQGDLADSVVAAAKKLAAASDCRDTTCEDKRVGHEVETAVEGSVNAYAGKKAESATTAVASKKGRGGIPDKVGSTRLSRTVAGDTCTSAKETCKMVPCSGLSSGRRGTKCKSGELLRQCESKQVPVRCADK